MNSELLFFSSSFDWLAKEIRGSRTRRNDNGENHSIGQKPERLGVPRLPADFSPDAAILKAEHLRALKFGELIGGSARKAVQAIAALAAWLNGDNRDDERVRNYLENLEAERLAGPRLPVNFSADDAILKAKHLRALKLRELLDGAARKTIQAIAALAARLNGNNRDGERVEHHEELRKAA